MTQGSWAAAADPANNPQLRSAPRSSVNPTINPPPVLLIHANVSAPTILDVTDVAPFAVSALRRSSLLKRLIFPEISDRQSQRINGDQVVFDLPLEGKDHGDGRKLTPDLAAVYPVPCKNPMPLKSLEGRRHYPLHDNLQQCTPLSTNFSFSSSPLLAG